jgi:hypothetical protein
MTGITAIMLAGAVPNPPFSVFAASVFNVLAEFGPVVVSGGPTTAVVTGGIGPFTYAWTMAPSTNSDIVALDPDQATTSFATADPIRGSAEGNATVTVTDTATSATATWTIFISLSTID